MSSSVFRCLSSSAMSKLVPVARARICYAAPGIQSAVADAICAAVALKPTLRVSVSIDFNETVLRMGYGSLGAVQVLKDRGLEVINSPGLRAAIFIVDDLGWIFTPTALYLEDEPHSEETPNAVRLTEEQLQEVMLRIAPRERERAITEAASADARESIENIVPEIGTQPVSQSEFALVEASIAQAPPVKFDVAKRVRVFEPYLQYVDINLRGAAIQRQRVQIPPALLRLGNDQELERRLRTTFDLIERDSEISSKLLERDIHQLRSDLTRSLGKRFGRVMLKSVRDRLDRRIESLREKLAQYQADVEAKIEEKLTKSRLQIIEHYLPTIEANPPDALLGQSLRSTIDENAIRVWIEALLDKVFPAPEDIVSKMSLDVQFKDVTFETLDDSEFFGCLVAAYPEIDWEKPYSEFQALGEQP